MKLTVLVILCNIFLMCSLFLSAEGISAPTKDYTSSKKSVVKIPNKSQVNSLLEDISLTPNVTDLDREKQEDLAHKIATRSILLATLLASLIGGAAAGAAHGKREIGNEKILDDLEERYDQRAIAAIQSLTDEAASDNLKKCLQEHADCPRRIDPGRSQQNLINESEYKRYHCYCDEEYKKCLYNVNDRLSYITGMLHFNVLRATCFTEVPPCKQWRGIDSDENDTAKCRIEFVHSGDYRQPSRFLSDYEIRESTQEEDEKIEILRAVNKK